jgi:transposase, IS5 family
MYQKDTGQTSFFGDLIYDRIFAKRSHWLKDLLQVVDFSFVNDLCQDLYDAPTGRPAWSPEKLFKVAFLQFCYDISDRRVEEELAFSLIFRYFVGLEADAEPPDHTTICRFRSKLGVERFQAIFNQIVTLARQRGFVTDRLHILDSTHIAAKVALFRLKQDQEDDDDDTYVDRGSPDPDARFGRKSPDKGFYGYKDHCALDADSGLIVATETTPGQVSDHQVFVPLLGGYPEEVTADKAYDSQENRAILSAVGIKNGIIPRKRRRGRPPASRRVRPAIERKFAEMKQAHGLAKARYWGLGKMAIQCLLTTIVVNCKRLVALTRMKTELEASLLPSR